MLHVSVIYGHLPANTKLTFETIYYVKMTAYWDIAPCSLAEVYFNQTTRRYRPIREGYRLHTCQSQNL
jgi:hypothetical protein